YDVAVRAGVARGALEGFRRRVQIAGTVIDDRHAHRRSPGSGKRPMTSDPVGGPRRTGVVSNGSAGGAGSSGTGALAGDDFTHSEKKRCSADSISSATTKPSVFHLRRVSVQRHSVAASKPTSKAMAP